MNSTRTVPPDARIDPPSDDLYCPVCHTDSSDCEHAEEYDVQVSATGRFADAYRITRYAGHRGEWVDKRERDAGDAADWYHEMRGDR